MKKRRKSMPDLLDGVRKQTRWRSAISASDYEHIRSTADVVIEEGRNRTAFARNVISFMEDRYGFTVDVRTIQKWVQERAQKQT